MDALEQKKWTPGGLEWDVTVPTEITLVFKPAHKAAWALMRRNLPASVLLGESQSNFLNP
jgi:hypothetical protein